ncbi:MAG: hypothetical protein NC401_13880 [Ruminococcus sp.]|nr:hypothetical protein [Ruminococcus sp.]
MENNMIIGKQERAVLLNNSINANANIAAESIGKVGRDLKAMRDERLYLELGCESFEEFCNEKTPIGQRQAYNFIRCWEKYGERLAELSNIGITKLALMAALDDEDSDALIESGDAETLSVRDLEKRVKELQHQNEQLTLELGEFSKEETKLEKMRGEMDKLRAELSAAKAVNEELAKRPVEVAVEKPSKADIKKIEDAAKKRYKKELAELRETMDRKRFNDVEAVKKENAAEIERLKAENASLQSNAKRTPPSAQKERVKFFVEECLRSFNAAVAALEELPDEEREKPQAAIKTMVARMSEVMSDEA